MQRDSITQKNAETAKLFAPFNATLNASMAKSNHRPPMWHTNVYQHNNPPVNAHYQTVPVNLPTSIVRLIRATETRKVRLQPHITLSVPLQRSLQTASLWPHFEQKCGHSRTAQFRSSGTRSQSAAIAKLAARLWPHSVLARSPSLACSCSVLVPSHTTKNRLYSKYFLQLTHR